MDDDLQRQLTAILQLVAAVGRAIHDWGPKGIPSGELYAHLMPTGIDLDTYTLIITRLKQAGLVKEDNHLLTWIGPPLPPEH